MSFPKIVIFDLDHTLWPYMAHKLKLPLYINSDGDPTDQNGVVLKLFPDVRTVLEWICAYDMSIAYASRSRKPLHVQALLDALDLEKYAVSKQLIIGTKEQHIRKIADETRFKFNEMLFFDDEQRNIDDLEPLGITCVHIEHGMTMEILKEGLEKYRREHPQKHVS